MSNASDIDIYRNMWVARHRPTTLDAMLLDDRIREEMLKFVEDDTIPHFLFYGDPGGGKTTLAKIIVNSLLDCQYLYINASDESGVDVVRGKIKDFATTKSLDGKIKVVILDEIDGTKADGNGTTMQKALRNVMESYAANVRFILTANNIGQINDAILSRCVIYNIVPNMGDYMKAIYGVLQSENITLPDVKTDEFKEFALDIRSRYPDIRKCINHMQRACVTGEYVKLEGNLNALKAICEAIMDIIDEQDPNKLRQYVIDQGDIIANDYRNLMHIMFNMYFETDLKANMKKRDAMLVISEHLKSNEVVMDIEINFYACCLHLMRNK